MCIGTDLLVLVAGYRAQDEVPRVLALLGEKFVVHGFGFLWSIHHACQVFFRRLMLVYWINLIGGK